MPVEITVVVGLLTIVFAGIGLLLYFQHCDIKELQEKVQKLGEANLVLLQDKASSIMSDVGDGLGDLIEHLEGIDDPKVQEHLAPHIKDLKELKI